MTAASRPDHDALHHRLFSHPGVVAQLLREFVAGPGGTGLDLADLDLDGMERLNAKFHAGEGQRREGDMIWRIPRRGGEDTYLVLLLEFQSTSDRYMALRVLTYATLLWQQLISERRLEPGGRLPPILPVLLYNGDSRWRAPVDLVDLVGLPGASPLWRWQPRLRYHLIDIGAFSDAELEGRDGLPALWFRLENAPDAGSVVAVADAVLEWLARHPGFAAARAVFAELLGAMMAPLGPGIRVPDDLLEVRNMLATRAERWKRDWLVEGRQAGIEEGRQAGIEEGRQAGIQAGIREGRHEGEVALLLRLLERRFGAVPGWVADRVRAAETAQLEEWGVRILDAGSLDDVFADRTA
jgi:hypothetical protein